MEPLSAVTVRVFTVRIKIIVIMDIFRMRIIEVSFIEKFSRK